MLGVTRNGQVASAPRGGSTRTPLWPTLASTHTALLPRVFPVPFGRKKPFRLLVFPLLALAFGVVAPYGCGTVVDREKLQDTVQASLESSIHEKIKEVECPSDQSVDPGATFTCDVIFSDDRREVATLKIRNEDADISMVGLKPEK
jgi:uncharacterized protein DUF4333